MADNGDEIDADAIREQYRRGQTQPTGHERIQLLLVTFALGTVLCASGYALAVAAPAWTLVGVSVMILGAGVALTGMGVVGRSMGAW